MQSTHKILILGIGNYLMGDEGIGVQVANKMIETKPRTLTQLGGISGVGQRKLEQYGQDFLAIIQVFTVLDRDDLSSSDISIKLFKLGVDVAKIVELRQLQMATVYAHLAEGISTNELTLSNVIPITAEEVAEIQAAILALPDEFKNALKPVFEQFEEKYSYEILRCVRAALC